MFAFIISAAARMQISIALQTNCRWENRYNATVYICKQAIFSPAPKRSRENKNSHFYLRCSKVRCTT
jgi:hypothetical protein